jgi:hypothetical protein
MDAEPIKSSSGVKKIGCSCTPKLADFSALVSLHLHSCSITYKRLFTQLFLRRKTTQGRLPKNALEKKKLKSNMNNLRWYKTGDAYYLASPAEELVKLQFELVGKTLFWMNHEVYEVRRSGFWNQRYAVYKNNKEVVSVSHNFWGSKGNIKFTDGIEYTSDYKYKNTLTLLFLDGDAEILSYHVGNEKGKHQTIFNPGIALVDAERLLLLATLGMVMFLNIFNEFKEDDSSFLLLATA